MACVMPPLADKTKTIRRRSKPSSALDSGHTEVASAVVRAYAPGIQPVLDQLGKLGITSSDKRRRPDAVTLDLMQAWPRVVSANGNSGVRSCKTFCLGGERCYRVVPVHAETCLFPLAQTGGGMNGSTDCFWKAAEGQRPTSLLGGLTFCTVKSKLGMR